MVRRSGYVTFASLAVMLAAGTARAQTPPADAPPPEAPPPAADAPVAAPPLAVPAEMPAPPAPAPAPLSPAPTPVAPSQLKIDIPNGTNIRLGVLFQPAYQVAGSVSRNGYSEDFFMRRTRILIGGSIMGAFDYFFDTDFANIGLSANSAGTMTDAMGMSSATSNTRKMIPGMNIQDAFVTWKSLGDAFKVDVGYMLPPLSHNAIQGATTLYGWDYFAFTFLHNAGFSQNGAATAANPALAGVIAGTTSVGRDMGVQVRGLVGDGKLEYRLGGFQGVRSVTNADDPTSSNAPRVAARLQLNLLDAESSFFYAGSYLGKKKIASIGASFDYQKAPTSSSFDDAYRTWDVDAFVDMPAGPGVFTFQGDFIGYHGGLVIPGLPKNTIGSEVGYLIGDVNISPIVRYERRWGGQVEGTDIPAIDRYALGVGFWPFGHSANVKVFYSRIQQENAMHGANQVNAQLQLYYY